jgi:pimeloyl-ACP methyl ester carboxylesterase
MAKLLSGPKLYAPVAGDVEKERMLRGLLDTMFPLSYRLPGILNDLEQGTELKPYPLKAISIPTLVIHGDADSIVPFSNGQHCAETIPGAQFLVIEGGDHLCFLTHLERTKTALIDFLKRHTPR